jgi:hypothetical protein
MGAPCAPTPTCGCGASRRRATGRDVGGVPGDRQRPASPPSQRLLSGQQREVSVDTILQAAVGVHVPINCMYGERPEGSFLHRREGRLTDGRHCATIGIGVLPQEYDGGDGEGPNVQPTHEGAQSRPPLPPFTEETAQQKVKAAEDAWNTRDPERVALAYTEDSRWRNREEFFKGREAIKEFLRRKWARELDYRLRKEMWCYTANRIAVRFEYESHDESGQWWRSHT